LSSVCDCLFNKFAAILHQQPEDVPCRGNKDPHNMDTKSNEENLHNKNIHVIFATMFAYVSLHVLELYLN